jgi:hypothetical protein
MTGDPKGVRSPSPQRGREARGEGVNADWSSRECLATLIQNQASGVDPAEMTPPHPQTPLPRWGEGSQQGHRDLLQRDGIALIQDNGIGASFEIDLQVPS